MKKKAYLFAQWWAKACYQWWVDSGIATANETINGGRMCAPTCGIVASRLTWTRKPVAGRQLYPPLLSYQWQVYFPTRNWYLAKIVVAGPSTYSPLMRPHL